MKHVNDTYYSLPYWGKYLSEGMVELFPHIRTTADENHIYRRTHFIQRRLCLTCCRSIKPGERAYHGRHLRHFWSEYVPAWQRAADLRQAAPESPDLAHLKEESRTPMSGILTIAVWLIYAVIVVYVVWLGVQAAQGRFK